MIGRREREREREKTEGGESASTASLFFFFFFSAATVRTRRMPSSTVVKTGNGGRENGNNSVVWMRRAIILCQVLIRSCSTWLFVLHVVLLLFDGIFLDLGMSSEDWNIIIHFILSTTIILYAVSLNTITRPVYCLTVL